MSGQLVGGAAILVGFVVVFAGIYVVARRRSRGIEAGVPDRASGEVVTGLMVELRKTQAEVAHWKSAAERLQRELDGRS